MKFDFPVVLGSRSPRRKELLAHLLPNGERQIEILPPSSSEEAGFAGITNWDDITTRLQSIARTKLDDVLRQIQDREHQPIVITADTVIVATDPENANHHVVLGQPPKDDWQNTVRDWFQRFLLGATHRAATAFYVSDGAKTIEQIVRTDVTFHNLPDTWIEWYLQTEEPIGKAGGYAIQGAGSVFVSSVNGSLSNVIGLPQRELLETLLEFADSGTKSVS